MLKSKAIDIIKTFSPEEFKRFSDFAESPYFNNVKSIVRLVKELSVHYPDFLSAELTERSLYEKVYGKGKYSYSVMKNLLSELISLCEKFLVHDRITKDIIRKNGNSIELLEELRDRGLDNLFNIRCKKFEKLFKEHVLENSEYFIQANKLEILKYRFHLNKHRYNELIWKGFLKKSTFELCSILHSLYITTDTVLQSAETLKGDSDDSVFINFVKELDLESFAKTIEPHKSEEYFFLSLYSGLILLTLNDTKDRSEKYYYELKKSFIKNLKYFSYLDAYDILKSLRSYCITRMRLMKSDFIDELYIVDKLLLETINFSDSSVKWYIGEIFSEIVLLSIYSKDYKFAEEFIEKYKDHLNKDVAEFETGFTKALLNLEYGNTDKALELLSVIKPVNYSMKTLIKNIYFRAYYDLQYYEEGLSVLDAYIHFINKDKNISEDKKRISVLKYNVYIKLYKIKMSPGKYSAFDIKNLKQELNKFYFLVEKEWFLKKLKELECEVN
ncbi:MAG TPA: hypothetical protein PK536_04180 [Ignavibacteria bacterium]|nr:hypothetical protein [Bacteroidota bacterium]HRI84625.1 hypothetical protein [Ignavibacteria bacterium]HRJ98911.1 hypothetical protein [Ignavibacteria bacterium]